jgi:hypothetical protein
MVWLKRPFSRVANLTKPAVSWQPLQFASLDEYAEWLKDHVEWVADPLGGVVDSFPSLGNAAFQLLSTGKFRDDCDGLAYFSAANVEPFCDRPEDRYLVTVLLNPFDIGWADAAHVMLFFKREGKWRVISNQVLYAPAWDTFLDALQHNDYVAGRPVYLAVVQTSQFKTVWWGKPGPEDSRPPALQ